MNDLASLKAEAGSVYVDIPEIFGIVFLLVSEDATVVER